MTVLLVANDGGHIMQLHTLRPRLALEDVVWVTPRTPQTESLLAGEVVHWVEQSPPRDMSAVIRNAVRCRVLFEQYTISMVVSTGAALALSVLPQAWIRNIETIYIESATRLAAPSLSGRMLALLPGVRTFSQSTALDTRRWTYLASPWDLYESAPQESRPISKMVVSLGTQEGYDFRRLLARLVPLVPVGTEVLWQTGSTDVDGLNIDGRARVSSAEMDTAIADADVVVAHAGTGIALAALEHGKYPVLVPRRASHGEHVDDHQLTIALELSLRDLCVTRDVDRLKLADLHYAAARRVVKATSPAVLDLVPRPRRGRPAALAAAGARAAE